MACELSSRSHALDAVPSAPGPATVPSRHQSGDPGNPMPEGQASTRDREPADGARGEPADGCGGGAAANLWTVATKSRSALARVLRSASGRVIRLPSPRMRKLLTAIGLSLLVPSLALAWCVGGAPPARDADGDGLN